MPRPAPFLSIPQAAAALGIDRTHLFRLAKAGEVKTMQTGRDLLIPVEEVARLKRERTFRPYRDHRAPATSPS